MEPDAAALLAASAKDTQLVTFNKLLTPPQLGDGGASDTDADDAAAHVAPYAVEHDPVPAATTGGRILPLGQPAPAATGEAQRDHAKDSSHAPARSAAPDAQAPKASCSETVSCSVAEKERAEALVRSAVLSRPQVISSKPSVGLFFIILAVTSSEKKVYACGPSTRLWCCRVLRSRRSWQMRIITMITATRHALC